MKGVKSRMGWVILSLILLQISLFSFAGSCPLIWSYSIDGMTVLSVSDNGNFVAIGCGDGYYYIFDTWGNLLGSGHVIDPVVSIDIANTGNLIMGFAQEYKFCTSDGAEISSFQTSPVRSVSMSSDGILSLVCCLYNVFINVENSMVQQIGQLSGYPLGAVSSDGSLACFASNTSLLILFDQYSYSYDAEEEIMNLFVSEDGQEIIFSTDEEIGYVDMETKVVQLLDMGVSLQEMATTPKGDITIISTGDGLIWLEEETVLNRITIDGQAEFLSLYDNGSVAIIGKKGGIVEFVTVEGTSLFTYDFESDIVALEVCEEADLLIVCTVDGLYAFQLFQEIQLNTQVIPIPSRKSLPKTSPFKELWSTPVADDAYFLTGDVDGDGLTDIILKEGTTLKLLDGEGHQKSVRDLGMKFALYYLFDVDGDTICEIPLTFNLTEFVFAVYDWKEDTIKMYNLGSLGGNTPLHTAEVMPLAILDSGDGSREIIGDAGVGYSCKPRGVISVDYASQEINWFYQTRGSPMSRAITDINGDGTVDIVVGSMAPCTCPDDAEYPDCEIYVTALSGTGEKLWQVLLGYGFRRVEICAADVDPCEGVEIIGFGYEASEVWGSLFVLNCDGEYLYNREFDYSIVPGAVGDIDGDGLKEIVAVDTRGVLSVFTSDLQEKKSQFIEEGINPRAHITLNDINGDGYFEILMNFDKKIWIFDKDLNISWKKEFESTITCGVANFRRCKNTLLIISDKLYAFAYEEDENPLCPLWAITKRTILHEATTSLNEGESLFAADEYRSSKQYFEHALEKFSQLEDQEKITSISGKIIEVSTIIFKQNVTIEMVFLAVCDVVLCVFLLCSWIIRKRWSRLGESSLLLTLPILLGLFQVYKVDKEFLYTFITYAVPSLIGSILLILRQNILGFLRTVAAILSGHKDMLVLSIVRSNGSYRVSVESIEEKFNPVKESRKVAFSEETRKNIIKKVEFMVGIFSQISSGIQGPLTNAEDILRENGAIIYRSFIPADFSGILRAKFLMLEVEDTEIPWELMYSDGFFAAKYAMSRRIVTTEPVNVRHNSRRRGKRALVISDPTETLTGANPECDIVYRRLKQKMNTTLVKGSDANARRVANLFGQEFNIIHFAGHVENGLLLSDGIMSSEEVKEFITGTPIVFVNGCKSEDLARAFLLGGAIAYIGTIHPIHDGSAAEIAADFYDLCLQYRIGEALKRAREDHLNKDLAWASLVMYGDPTLKLL